MSYDFFAEHEKKKPDIRKWNQYTILKCTREDDDNYKKSIQRVYKQKQIDPLWKYTKWFVPASANLDNSTNIKIDFELKKPYISRDDEEFWSKDNPICKDKVFKIPLVRASSWKGALRWASYKQYIDKLETGQINNENWKKEKNRLFRLFGSEKDNLVSWINQIIALKLNKNAKEVENEFKEYIKENDKRKGRLFFYPTFFDNISLDVIAPHNRDTRTVINPINLEIVPKGTKSILYLLYFPFDLIESKNSMNKEKIEDFRVLTDAIENMFTNYGFGAKTTSGYGIAEINNININGKDYGNDFNKAFEGIKNEWKSN
jgi:CRISPR-associated protein Cmr2